MRQYVWVSPPERGRDHPSNEPQLSAAANWPSRWCCRRARRRRSVQDGYRVRAHRPRGATRPAQSIPLRRQADSSESASAWERYPRRVRRLAVLAALALGLAACGSSATPADSFRVTFGIAGGNVVPWTVVIHRDGVVTTRRSTHMTVDLSTAKRATLFRDVLEAFASGLRSRRCPGTLPDIATRYIRAGHHVARVHGACEPEFTKLWNELVRASGRAAG
jgi:hypothetical protein